MSAGRVLVPGAFLLLSLLAHAAFVYNVHFPVVPAQTTLPLLNVKVVSTADEQDRHSEAKQPMKAAHSAVASSSAFNQLTQNKLQQESIGNQSDIAIEGDVQMMPILRVHELLPDRVNSELLNDVEYVQSPSGDVRYLNAMEVEKRVRAKQNLTPVYPADAYSANRSGRVVLELLINEEGGLDQLRTIAATPEFEASARNALRNLTFYPAELHGEKVASRLLIEMKYLLVQPSSGDASKEEIMPIGTVGGNR